MTPAPQPTASASDPPPRAQPASATDLFISFTLLALQGFGGVLAVVQREMVEKKKWMTRQEFIEEWAVAQVLPGPNVVNLAIMFGGRHFGMRGAFAAVAGLLVVPLVIVLLLMALYTGVADSPVAQGALRGMGAVAGGLVAATGLRLLPALRKHPMGKPVCAAFLVATFIAIALLRLPLLWVLLSIGTLASVWTYRQLKRAEEGGR